MINAQRDLRIDYFRGIALCMIFVDHIDLNPFARYTYHRYGFSDAAEVFVFLSGVSCGIAYSAVLTRHGFGGLMRELVNRAALIYASYLALSIFAILLSIHGNAEPSLILHAPDAGLNEPGLAAVWKAALLIQQPSIPGILVLYIPLALIAIPAFLLGARRSPRPMLVASAALWGAVQLIDPQAATSTLFPYFNPFAWQFLFVIGIYFGQKYKELPVSMYSSPSMKWLATAACTIVMYCLSVRMLGFVAKTAGPEFGLFVDHDVFDPQFYPQLKYNLAPIRLLHFGCIAVLVAAYVRPDHRFLTWGNHCIANIGRWPLQVFCVGAVLSIVGTLVFAQLSPTPFEKLAFDVGGILVLMLTGSLFSTWKSYRRKSQVGSSVFYKL